MVEPVEETQTSGSCNLLLCKQFFARCVACLRSSAWLAILHATAGPGEAGGRVHLTSEMREGRGLAKGLAQKHIRVLIGCVSFKVTKKSG